MRPFNFSPDRFSFKLIGLLALAQMNTFQSVMADDATAHALAKQKTAPYYQDAQLCRAKSVIDALPEGADPLTSIDPGKFIPCINKKGYQQEAKTDPFLVAVQRCRQHKMRSVSASGEHHFHSPSQAQVRACLVGRGFPSTGTPPNPNAPVDQGVNTDPAKTTTPNSSSLKLSPAPASGTPEEGVQTVVIPPRNRSR